MSISPGAPLRSVRYSVGFLHMLINVHPGLYTALNAGDSKHTEPDPAPWKSGTFLVSDTDLGPWYLPPWAALQREAGSISIAETRK